MAACSASEGRVQSQDPPSLVFFEVDACPRSLTGDTLYSRLCRDGTSNE